MKTINVNNIKRHGDLILRAVASIPSDAKAFSKGKLNKLALGETTGHSHKLMTTVDVEVFESNGEKYFKLPSEATLEHEEHNTITLEPIVWKVSIKREFDYVGESIRTVRD